LVHQKIVFQPHAISTCGIVGDSRNRIVGGAGRSATFVGRLCWLRTLSLLRGCGLPLLLPLSILRGRGLFSCSTVHRGGRRMSFIVGRRTANGLAGVAWRWTGARVLAAGVAGAGMSRGDAYCHYGATCEDQLFHQCISLYPPSMGSVFGAV
jgi:hypothetical protein